MLVTSSKYFVFLIVVFFIYWSIAKKANWRMWFLLAAGYVFYSQAGLLPILLLFSVSTIDFSTTRTMNRCATNAGRKRLLMVSLLVDIGVLCVFKYTNF